MAKSDSAVHKRSFFDWRFFWTDKRRVNRLAFILFWSILMTVFVKLYVISLGIVRDISMNPTLPEGGYYLVNKYIYHLAPPERGDIVVFRRNGYASPEYVKRVIGRSGETLTIRSGRVFINGRPLIEPYVKSPTYPDLGPVRIEKDTYFVLGDNRLVSEDSRHYGAIPIKWIEGKIKPGELFPLR